MSDLGVKTMFQKDTYKMVWGEIVLIRGTCIGTLYKLLGSIISDGLNNCIFLEIGL